jgi:N-acetylglucosamine-6-phosphate deacetylase
MIALTASSLLTPVDLVEHPVVLIEDRAIQHIGSRADIEIPSNASIVDFGDATLAPGLIDIHIHGGAGHDVMESGPHALPCIEKLLFRHGVTSYLPTTVTGPLDLTLAALDRLADAVEQNHPDEGDGRCRPVGIHVEGPFLSHARRGVHPPAHLLQPTLARFDRLWQAARGHIKVMTIAPELDGAAEVIAEATRRGVCVSFGHSDATLEAARAGVLAGARHATHTFNAMRPIAHRDPGVLDLILTEDRMTADIIADGVHVHPVLVKLFMRTKGPERAVLITDGLAATGMPDGHYRLGGLDFDLKDGRCLSGDTLAGSVLTLDRAVRNAMEFASLDFSQALRAATLNPATAATLPCGRGMLKAGAIADIVAFNREHEVIKTIVGGTGI